MSVEVDLFSEPNALFSSAFDPLACSVLGIKIGDPESVLTGWEVLESNEKSWKHLAGGVAYQIHEGLVSRIKLPYSFIGRLEESSLEGLSRFLGVPDESRRRTFGSRLILEEHIWNVGIVFWQMFPEAKFSHMVIFDPLQGIKDEASTERADIAVNVDRLYILNSLTTTFSLDSGVERHRLTPETFEIPPQHDRENLHVGEIVKLLFCIKINQTECVERMWVQIIEVRSEIYVGRLDNDPSCTTEIRCGMRVEFNADHIIQIWS